MNINIFNSVIYPFLAVFLSACGNDDNLSNAQTIKKAGEFANMARSPLLKANDAPWSFEKYFREASENIASILPKIGKQPTLSDCVSATVSKIVKAPVREVKSITAGIATGLSGNMVFRVYEPNQTEPSFIAKSFKYQNRPHISFAKEIGGITLIQDLKLKHSHAVTIRGLAQCEVGNDIYDILVQDFASGELVYNTLADLSTRRGLNTKEHNAAKLKAIKSMQALGRSLGEFHSSRSAKRDYLNPTLSRDLKNIFTGAIRNLQKDSILAAGINFIDLQKAFDGALATLQNSQLEYGVSHGDAHLGNFLFDFASNSLTMIDLDRTASSLSKDSEPLGLPAIDFLRIMRSIELLQSMDGGISKSDADHLRQAFENDYIKHGGSLPSAAETEALGLFMLTVHVPPIKDTYPRKLFIKFMCKKYPVPGPPEGACKNI